MKVHPHYPQAKVLVKILLEADDALMELYKHNAKPIETSRIGRARGRINDAIELLEAQATLQRPER